MYKRQVYTLAVPAGATNLTITMSGGTGDADMYVKAGSTPVSYTHLDVYKRQVYNKAFCLLAKTSGWTTKKAFQVFARANRDYWTSSSTFNQGACGVEKAATALGYTKASVTAAFTAVGVKCA